VQRRQDILDLVIAKRHVEVTEISRLFGVSRVTVRADLEFLAKQHLIQRTRGGAVVSMQQSLALSFAVRALLEREAKQRISRAAGALVVPGETIIVDAGSTLAEFASCMSATRDLTVVTPALNIATHLGSLPGLELIIIGGRLDRDTISSVGPAAEHQFRDVLAHKVFLGGHSIDEQGDIAERSLEIAALKRAMIRAAREVILLADSTKWVTPAGKAKVAPISSMNVVVTDERISLGARRAMEEQGVKVIIA